MSRQTTNYYEVRQRVLEMLKQHPVLPLRQLCKLCKVRCINTYLYPKESDPVDYRFPLVDVLTHNRNKIVAHENYRLRFTVQEITAAIDRAIEYIDRQAAEQNALIGEGVRNSRAVPNSPKFAVKINRTAPPTLLTLLEELNPWPASTT